MRRQITMTHDWTGDTDNNRGGVIDRNQKLGMGIQFCINELRDNGVQPNSILTSPDVRSRLAEIRGFIPASIQPHDHNPRLGGFLPGGNISINYHPLVGRNIVYILNDESVYSGQIILDEDLLLKLMNYSIIWTDKGVVDPFWFATKHCPEFIDKYRILFDKVDVKYCKMTIRNLLK